MPSSTTEGPTGPSVSSQGLSPARRKSLMTIRRILVAYSSDASESVGLRVAIDLARRHEATLTPPIWKMGTESSSTADPRDP